jgi:16S rRNA processing protein RimM
MRRRRERTSASSSTSSKTTAGPERSRRRPPDVVEHGGERLVVIGELVGVHGVRGELRLRPFNPASTTLARVREVFLLEPGTRSVALRAARPHGRVWLVRLEAVETPEAAAPIVGRAVAVRETDLEPLGRAEFYHYQLRGLAAVDEDGASLGRVREVLTTGAVDVLAVERDGRELLVPVVEEFVRRVDLAAGRVVLRPVEGMLQR